jgi:AcrR family transcriptional regulator
MARPREFDREQALDAAVVVFGEHGFAGTNTEMLTAAMKIGRQSLYDTFGDKWQLYCNAVDRYSAVEVSAHIQMLRSGKGLEGISKLIDRVVVNARTPCLGTNSVSEFGLLKSELVEIRAKHGKVFEEAIDLQLKGAQADGELSIDLDRRTLAAFIFTNITALRVAARGGMDETSLRSISHLLLKAIN